MGDEPFWIREPGLIWVSDEYVYSLVSVLERALSTLSSIWWALGSVTSTRTVFDPIPSRVPRDSEDQRRALGRIMDDVSWLRGALVSYAQETAAQERARATRWDEPAERILALWVAAVTGSNREGALGDNPLGHAAGSVAQGFPRDHRVSVREVPMAREIQAPPGTISERIARIPDPDTPIRIERYVSDQGDVRAEVYIAGTHEWSMGSSLDPFDMESNVALVAGVPAASLLGVHRAMTRAGIKPGDAVTFTGHSQGGIIAARLAESGRYRTTGLLTVGSPLGTLAITGSYPALALRHTDDLVPRLGGSDRTSGVMVVERPSGAAPGDIVGAHERTGYHQTAQNLDSSPARPRLPELPVPEGRSAPRLYVVRRVG